jgi:hypothetical protein
MNKQFQFPRNALKRQIAPPGESNGGSAGGNKSSTGLLLFATTFVANATKNPY